MYEEHALALNEEVIAEEGPLTVKFPVDAEQIPDETEIVCVPALNPETVNGLLVYATDDPPSTVYVPVETVPNPERVTVAVPFEPPKQVTALVETEATTAHPFNDKF